MLKLINSYFYRPDKDIPAYLNKRPGKDAGYDLYAAEDVWFWPLQTRKVKSNSHIHVPSGHFGHVAARGGHASRGWLTQGVVDHGYSGNIGIFQTNLSFLPRRIKKGERVAQLVFVPFTAVQLMEFDRLDDYQNIVKKLSNSDRQDKACNSSGTM